MENVSQVIEGNHLEKVVSPIDGSVYVEIEQANKADIDLVLDQSVEAQKLWKETTIEEKRGYLEAFMKAFEAHKDDIAEELTWQMGRPIKYSPFEINGMLERAEHMVSIAEKSLSDIDLGELDGAHRLIKRNPVGVVLVLAPWNYPLLTAINVIIPALMSGNTVVLKHSSQTPLCAERFAQAFEESGLPDDVFQVVHTSHDLVEDMVKDSRVNFVAFTGSVKGGEAVEKAAAGRFIGVGLELGGKDPAYVRADALVDFAVENVADGVFFNSGQSCCGVERIYVHENIYDSFVEKFVEFSKTYILDDPTKEETTLGPMVRANAADYARKQVADAVAAGARSLIDPSLFDKDESGSPYMAPQVLVDVTHDMDIMKEESFAPIVGIMKVSSDDEAIALMNDSDLGLTASIWTADVDKGFEISQKVETGTCFVNRCDYLDPALAWTGVKNTGRGCTLSELGYHQLTQPKSYYLRGIK